MGEAARRKDLGLGPKNINIDASTLEDRLCANCGGKFFAEAMCLKEIPAILSPSSQPETVMIKQGFVCVGCGTIKSLRPTPDEGKKVVDLQPGEPKKEESKIILVGGH